MYRPYYIYIFNCLLTEVPIQGSSENNIVLTIDASLAIAHFIDSSPLKYRRNMSMYFCYFSIKLLRTSYCYMYIGSFVFTHQSSRRVCWLLNFQYRSSNSDRLAGSWCCWWHGDWCRYRYSWSR